MHVPANVVFIHALKFGYVGAALATSWSNGVVLCLNVLYAVRFKVDEPGRETWPGFSFRAATTEWKPFLALALPLSLGACATLPAATEPATETASQPVTVGIIGLNDFHGNLQPGSRPRRVDETTQVQAGGAAYLASAIDSLRARQENTLVISAGDLISASPLVSSLFLDEPTIGAMNRIGLDFNAVGNHEFDRGWRELKRLVEGGCEKLTMREPCAVEPDYAGAQFGFLAANVLAAPEVSQDGTLFPGTAIRRFGEGERAVAVAVLMSQRHARRRRASSVRSIMRGA